MRSPPDRKIYYIGARIRLVINGKSHAEIQVLPDNLWDLPARVHPWGIRQLFFDLAKLRKTQNS
jgi:hypothetical protein